LVKEEKSRKEESISVTEEKTHTMKEANKYFDKLKYVVDNFKDLEQKIDSLKIEISGRDNANIDRMDKIEAVLHKIIRTEIEHYSSLIEETGAYHPQWRDLIKRRIDWEKIEEQFGKGKEAQRFKKKTKQGD